MTQPPTSFILVCKEDCQTCTQIEPVFAELAATDVPLAIYSQDNPAFPNLPNVIHDATLEKSFRLDIEIVPTLIKMVNGREQSRIIGWNKSQWRTLTNMPQLGESMPIHRPGCGAKNVEPSIAEELALRFGDTKLTARKIEITAVEDEMEACFNRGWTDGLPVVPPTAVRVYRMLQGTTRGPDEIVGIIPPNNVPCTVEKVAINAVLAGCKPEYMPVVLATVEAACLDEFCMHGLIATTYFSSPVVIVNGPIVHKIGMNSGLNALGQGNRANATIGRALQLIIRNVGGGRPGGVDRATLGNPGKYTFCFAEDEVGSPWESLGVERGFDASVSTITLFAGDGVQAIMDQLSREPESLAKTFATSLRTVAHAKLAMAADAILVISPEHSRVFREAGWSKAQLREAIMSHLQLDGAQIVRGANGIAEGVPQQFESAIIPKFRPDGLHIVHAGGTAGLFSAIIGGWVASGPVGSTVVTVAVKN